MVTNSRYRHFSFAEFSKYTQDYNYLDQKHYRNKKRTELGTQIHIVIDYISAYLNQHIDFYKQDIRVHARLVYECMTCITQSIKKKKGSKDQKLTSKQALIIRIQRARIERMN